MPGAGDRGARGGASRPVASGMRPAQTSYGIIARETLSSVSVAPSGGGDPWWLLALVVLGVVMIALVRG